MGFSWSNPCAYSERVESSSGWLDRPLALRVGEASLREDKAESFDFHTSSFPRDWVLISGV